MVNDLFATPGGGQEVDTGVFANDVVTVQTAEIGLMLKLRKDELP
jgi:succinylarginine dihydrolase